MRTIGTNNLTIADNPPCCQENRVIRVVRPVAILFGVECFPTNRDSFFLHFFFAFFATRKGKCSVAGKKPLKKAPGVNEKMKGYGKCNTVVNACATGCGNSFTIIIDNCMNFVPFQFFSTLEKCQFDQEADPHNFACQFLDHCATRLHRSARC